MKTEQSTSNRLFRDTQPSRMGSICSYVDYRAFLRDWAEAKRVGQIGWSYKVWAKRLGLKSSSTLIMIVNGQRHPGKTLTEKLTKDFCFNAKDASYFRDLVRLEKVRKDVGLSLDFAKEFSQRHPGKSFRVLDQKSFHLISNWYNYAIREMVHLRGFNADPAWIKKHLTFPVPKKTIPIALNTLTELGLLKKTPEGEFRYGDANVETTTDIADHGLKKFHDQTLRNAADYLWRSEPSERGISGVTFAMNMSQLDRAKKMIRGFLAESCRLLEDTDTDTIFQFEIALFPVASSKEEPKVQ